MKDACRPFVVLLHAAEGIAKDKPADRIAATSRAVRIQLTALVSIRNVELREIAKACHLNVVGGLEEVCALDGPIGYETCAISALGTQSKRRVKRASNTRTCMHHETSYDSVSPIVEFEPSVYGGAQRHYSTRQESTDTTYEWRSQSLAES